NARRALDEARQFVDITQKQEQGGEAAHSDVVKAQVVLEQRTRDVQEAEIAFEKARIGLAVLIFADLQTDYNVVDDLDTITPLPPLPDVQTLARRNNPDVRAAQAAVSQETQGMEAARGAIYPTLSFQYLFGIDASQYALHNAEHQNNLGNAAVVELNIPVW